MDMHALSSLMQEHNECLKVADALDAYVSKLERGVPAAAEDLADFARLFRERTDEVHHEKEEHVLLPYLVRHGFDWSQGTLADICRQHEHERYLNEVLQHLSSRGPLWFMDHQRDVLDAALALVAFQRQHIQKETTQLFPEVLARLTSSELDELGRQLADFDSNARSKPAYAELDELSRRLIARYRDDGADLSGAGVNASERLATP
jgi:hemerythrin-like domain-containing protein